MAKDNFGTGLLKTLLGPLAGGTMYDSLGAKFLGIKDPNDPDKVVKADAGEKPGMKKGGKVKKYAKGGSVSKRAKGGSVSKRADGCAIKGKTKGRFV